MRKDVLITTTMLAALGLAQPLQAQTAVDCHASPQRPNQRCNADDYRFPLIDVAPEPAVAPLNQRRRGSEPHPEVNHVLSAYPQAWVGVTRVELTSETNEWVTVTIESIESSMELSFTHSQSPQALYLEPGVYRVRFRPTLSNRLWQSGYISVGSTNTLTISFNQASEQVVIENDPAAWSSDGSVRY